MQLNTICRIIPTVLCSYVVGSYLSLSVYRNLVKEKQAPDLNVWFTFYKYAQFCYTANRKPKVNKKA